MAGRRRSEASQELFPDGYDFETEDDYRKAANRLFEAAVNGYIESSNGLRAAQDSLRCGLAALRQSNERRRIDELKDICDRAEALHAEGSRHEREVREHRVDPKGGEWDVDEWRRALAELGLEPSVQLLNGDREPHAADEPGDDDAEG